ncbi:fatty acid oxidation complex subunit alpha FadJ [Arhodomonas sp. SL1]|uniref:fatty acid oxidation complex subunit alpha FadJ n=1 Tax=Arhodomonas sp. SL1 TaxID=3425691 RepID=UPI003F8859B7
MAADTPEAAAPLWLERRDDGIAVVRIDTPGHSQNTLDREAVNAASHILDELAGDNAVAGVVFASGKPGSFIAGADVQMIHECASSEEASALARTGQRIFSRIAAFRVPVVAAIDGICLGGGLELALACHGRVASDAAHTRLGLPEVQLGLLPGSGGTQRLPRLVGLPAALEMMLTGREVRARKARRMGLVDEVVPAAILEQAAVARVAGLKGGGRRLPLRERITRWALTGNPAGRALVLNRAGNQTRQRTHGNYPAPERILECVGTGLSRGMEAGLDGEARAFGELAMTPEARALMGIYFATTAMKKERGADAQPRELRRTAVLGAGLMGGGIGFVTASRAGLPVRLKDVRIEGLSAALRHVAAEVEGRRRRGTLPGHKATLVRRRVTPTLEYSGFRQVDLVFEAVPEELALKHRMLAEIEAVCEPTTVFASNTSSLPIARIAEGARRPGNVVGMHYFSPVERMPLVEVIPHAGTDPEVVATAVALARRQGKTPVVVGDAPGFYVNRILAPYINEAIHLLGEGVGIHLIDRALVGFGFPVGPFKLLDEVGLDVSAHVAGVLHEAFGERMRPTEVAQRMIDDGRLGRKAGRGFYRYGGRSAGEVDETVYELLDIQPRRVVEAEEIVRRTVGLLLNEAVRCLDEGIIAVPRDGDIAAVYGFGFPPFRGGPFHYMDHVEADAVCRWLDGFRRDHGERFAPASGLVARAEGRGSFYAEGR